VIKAPLIREPDRKDLSVAIRRKTLRKRVWSKRTSRIVRRRIQRENVVAQRSRLGNGPAGLPTADDRNCPPGPEVLPDRWRLDNA
jgi:hypothetical protein